MVFWIKLVLHQGVRPCIQRTSRLILLSYWCDACLLLSRSFHSQFTLWKFFSVLIILRLLISYLVTILPLSKGIIALLISRQIILFILNELTMMGVLVDFPTAPPLHLKHPLRSELFLNLSLRVILWNWCLLVQTYHHLLWLMGLMLTMWRGSVARVLNFESLPVIIVCKDGKRNWLVIVLLKNTTLLLSGNTVVFAIPWILRGASFLTLYLSRSSWRHFSNSHVFVKELHLADTAEVLGLILLIKGALLLMMVVIVRLRGVWVALYEGLDWFGRFAYRCLHYRLVRMFQLRHWTGI